MGVPFGVATIPDKYSHPHPPPPPPAQRGCSCLRAIGETMRPISGSSSADDLLLFYTVVFAHFLLPVHNMYFWQSALARITTEWNANNDSNARISE